MRGKHQIQLNLSDLKPDRSLIRRIFKLGFPASVEQSTIALGLTVMTFLVATFGTLSLAAYGIGIRVFSFIIIPAVGFAMATSTLVGQNIGAGKVDRAEEITKLSAKIGFVVLTFIGIVIFLFAKQISSTFIPGELKTIEESVLFIRIMSLAFGFTGVQMVINGAFRGSGNTLISMMISLISLWVFRVPIAYLLSTYTHLAEVGIWIAFPVANIISATIAVIWFSKGTWKRKKITEEVKLNREITQETIIEEGLE